MDNSIPPDEFRKIPGWTRKYAQNRALPQLVLMLVWGLIFFSLFWSAYAGGQAHRAGLTVRFDFWLAIFVVSMAANLYIAIPSRSRRFLQMLDARLYKSEGKVTVEPGKTARGKLLVPALFGACVLGQVALGASIPDRYQQPVSALYVIPFMIYLVRSGQSVGGLGVAVVWWTALYTLHAALLLAGIPILFENQWVFLNMLIPTAGYGALSFLAAHLYSRFALRRLRQLG